MSSEKTRIFETTAARTESGTPADYRLALRSNGLVLQGAYRWSEGGSGGHEWRDIPTVDLTKGNHND